MDIKSLRDREINKRVRDMVSRDQNRLRETFDKYDKQCADRMAEIHHMQEKVRFSMRSLAMDKIHINQASSVTSSYGTRVKSDVKDDQHVGKQTKTRGANEFSKRHRSSVTSMLTMTADRRTSTSPKPPRPEACGNISCADNKACGYMTRTLGRTLRPHTRLTDNMLSVNDLRMSTKSPIINLRRKSADDVQCNRQVSEKKRDRDLSPNRLQTGPCSVRQRSTSVSHLPSPPRNSPCTQRKLSATGQKGSRDRSPNRLRTGPCSVRQRSTSVSHSPSPHENSPSTQRKLSATGQKVELFRSRSNSLPDLLSPDSTLTATKQSGSSDIASMRRQIVQTSKPIPISGSALSQHKVVDGSLARSFEEMRHCRYLRCRSDTDI